MIDEQIEAWRSHLRSSPALTRSDTAELEDHLHEQMGSLVGNGLSRDEAFLVAIKRMGAIDALTREFAREHSDRLWKQLVLSGGSAGEEAETFGAGASRKMWVALALALGAAVAIKVPALFGVEFDPDKSLFYPMNIAFFTLPFIAAYFAWERRLTASSRLWLLGVFAVSAVIVNAFSFTAADASAQAADTQELIMLHLPISLWLAVGVAYVGGRWRGSERRMDFIRFTGELFIYFVLIMLGGGVLVAVTFALFQAIGIDPQPLVQGWALPCGFAAATVVATWLVEAKQSVIENIAPVLARIFIPLFVMVLIAFILTMVGTGQSIDARRDILIAVDLLLAVVFGLLLYAISARDPLAPAGFFDWIQLTLVGAALLVDVLALWAVGARIADFGFTPNRLAALGMNLVLLVNLAGSAFLFAGFLSQRMPFSALWDWHMRYLYVIAGWAAVVAFLFPVWFTAG